MGLLKGFLWFCFAIGMIAVAMYLTGNYELADRLTALFVVVQPYLPLQLDVDLFLVVVTVLSLLLAALALGGCAGMLLFTGSRLGLARQQTLAAQAAAQREIAHVKELQEQQLQRLQTVSQAFVKRLDKGLIIQALVQSASRITSGSHANGVVSLWLLQFGTEALRFELGLYCDEALFTQSEFPLSEAAFARVLTSRKPWVLERWETQLTMVRREKAIAAGLPAGALVVPLVIEEVVLGILVVLCHPDIVKGYEGQEPFYEAMWHQLALGLAVAIQGELAIFDRLTGTYNRDYFLKRLIQEIDRANRFQFPLSVLMVDVDNFKAVNDTLGHPQGDAVLKIIAKLLRHEVRAIDLVARYGGEEFIVLLPETGLGDESGSASGALIVAERIRRAVDDEFHGLQKPLNLTISIGLAVRRFPEDRAHDHRELIRLADEQLYRAKASGKNKVCVAQSQPAAPQGQETG